MAIGMKNRYQRLEAIGGRGNSDRSADGEEENFEGDLYREDESIDDGI